MEGSHLTLICNTLCGRIKGHCRVIYLILPATRAISRYCPRMRAISRYYSVTSSFYLHFELQGVASEPSNLVKLVTFTCGIVFYILTITQNVITLQHKILTGGKFDVLTLSARQPKFNPSNCLKTIQCLQVQGCVIIKIPISR